jgi:hypothetical protein
MSENKTNEALLILLKIANGLNDELQSKLDKIEKAMANPDFGYFDVYDEIEKILKE